MVPALKREAGFGPDPARLFARGGTWVDVDRDRDLLRRCRRGDEKAWALLVERYENLVYSAALHTGIDRETAVDVFQQVWIEFHRSLFRIRNPRALPRWFTVTARRIAYRQAVLAGRWTRELREEAVDPMPAHDAALIALETRQRLEMGLARLQEKCRVLLTELFLKARRPSYQSLAERLGMKVGAIGPLRARCLRRLRRILEEET